jgi:fluoroquinolone transport system ATP-binding protein
VIQVRNLSYAYPSSSRLVLQDIDFTIAQGEIFGIMGPTGAGKSALMGILAGRIRDYTGSVSFQGKDYRNWSRDFYEAVGVSLEPTPIFRKLSVRENLTAYARLYRDCESVSALLERACLTAQSERRAATLAPGMRKRLDVARALLPKPQCLLTDEPLSGLQGSEVGQMMGLLSTQKRAGRSIVVATSDASLIHGLCDRWISLAEGRMTGMRKGADS